MFLVTLNGRMYNASMLRSAKPALIRRALSFDLRDASQTLYLPIAKPRTDYLKRTFSYSGACLWNDLP